MDECKIGISLPKYGNVIVLSEQVSSPHLLTSSEYYYFTVSSCCSSFWRTESGSGNTPRKERRSPNKTYMLFCSSQYSLKKKHHSTLARITHTGPWPWIKEWSSEEDKSVYAAFCEGSSGCVSPITHYLANIEKKKDRGGGGWGLPLYSNTVFKKLNHKCTLIIWRR